MNLNLRPTAILVMLAVVAIAAGCATTDDRAQESSGGTGAGNETAADGGNTTAGDGNVTLPDLTIDPVGPTTPGP